MSAFCRCLLMIALCLCERKFLERYNRTVRYDWLAHYLFDSIEQVQAFATRWLCKYSNERSNMALGGITPRQKLAMLA
jgi:putative transposase